MVGTPLPPSLEIILYLCLHPLTQNDHIRKGNTCREEACFLEVSHASRPLGGAQHFPVFGFPVFMFTHRMTKFDVVTRGGGLLLGQPHHP